MRFRHTLSSCAALALVATSVPALAHDHAEPGTAPTAPGADLRPEWKDAPAHVPPHHTAAPQPGRDAWLSECRRRTAVRDDGLGGALIGGVVGGVAGNRIAGRGNRAIGTVAGAAVGAVAGAAIDQAEDRGRVRDECEAYLDSYYDYYTHASRGYGHAGYGYAQGGCCQPARAEPECTETVEYVYEDVPVRPRARRIPDKRVRIVPDKRIKVN